MRGLLTSYLKQNWERPASLHLNFPTTSGVTNATELTDIARTVVLQQCVLRIWRTSPEGRSCSDNAAFKASWSQPVLVASMQLERTKAIIWRALTRRNFIDKQNYGTEYQSFSGRVRFWSSFTWQCFQHQSRTNLQSICLGAGYKVFRGGIFSPISGKFVPNNKAIRALSIDRIQYRFNHRRYTVLIFRISYSRRKLPSASYDTQQVDNLYYTNGWCSGDRGHFT